LSVVNPLFYEPCKLKVRSTQKIFDTKIELNFSPKRKVFCNLKICGFQSLGPHLKRPPCPMSKRSKKVQVGDRPRGCLPSRLRLSSNSNNNSKKEGEGLGKEKVIKAKIK
jgi:hypothetical protein